MKKANAETSTNQLKYLNPLIFESQIFVNNLNKYGQTFNTINEDICSALENVAIAINTFLSQFPKPTCDTEVEKLVEMAQPLPFNILYSCKFCPAVLKNPARAREHFNYKHQQNTNLNQNINTKTQAPKKKEAKAKVINLPKKTKSLLTGDLLIKESILIGEKLKKLPDYDIIEKELLSLVVPLFPEQTVKLYFFGSRMIGLAQPHTDLDIYIDIGRSFSNCEYRASETTMKNLHLVKKAIAASKSWGNLNCIDKARVPILKVSHKMTNIECDIGFSNSLGVCNTSLRKYLFELQPIAKRMSIFLKKWLERSKLDKFSSYSMTLMLVSFLQINKVLPSIESLQNDLHNTEHIGPWIGAFVEKSLQQLNLKKVDESIINCKKLLKLFFEWYAEYDYAKYIICPYFGREIDISTIDDVMPERYTSYVKTSNELKLHITSMVVQDPFQLNHNVTKSAPLLLLKSYFRQSANALDEG